MTRPARIRAAFYRGGTSKAVVFNGADLPADPAIRNRIFLHVMGSPDRYGRQLDGMGGGLSSVSKVVIVEAPTHPDADVDYTFVQIAVNEALADYGSACGNMSSAVGPFAVEEGLVSATEGRTKLRIHNTNTGQIYVSDFAVQDGVPVEDGDFEIPGVTQTGAQVRLDFLDPGGAITGTLLPTGHARDTLHVPDVGTVEVSMIDAANPVAFVHAEAFGLTATENPATLDANTDLMAQLDKVRKHAAVAMGMAATPEQAKASNPKIAIVGAPAPFTALDGRSYDTSSHDINIRMISMGNFHRAVTLTGAMCIAVGAKIPGSVVAQTAKSQGSLRIGNPSGVLPVDANVSTKNGTYHARSATTFRTQRRLMEGNVLIPAGLLQAKVTQ